MKTILTTEFPTQVYKESNATELHIVDYTDMTNSQRGLELHTTKPNDINSFCMQNETTLEVCFAPFDDHAFKSEDNVDLEH